MCNNINANVQRDNVFNYAAGEEIPGLMLLKEVQLLQLSLLGANRYLSHGTQPEDVPGFSIAVFIDVVDDGRVWQILSESTLYVEMEILTDG
jgi:hypothetical protein